MTCIVCPQRRAAGQCRPGLGSHPDTRVQLFLQRAAVEVKRDVNVALFLQRTAYVADRMKAIVTGKLEGLGDRVVRPYQLCFAHNVCARTTRPSISDLLNSA